MHGQRTVLVADDDPTDRGLLRYAVAKVRAKASYQFVHDGEEVLSYLNGTGAFVNRETFPPPDAVVLDLKMRRLGGLEVIKRIKMEGGKFPGLKLHILTGTEDPRLLEEVNGSGAILLRKPATLDLWMELVRKLDW